MSKKLFFIFLVLLFGLTVLTVSVGQAAKQFNHLDFNYSIEAFKDRLSILFTFDQKSRAELFLTLSKERQENALALAGQTNWKTVFGLAQRARGYLNLALLSGQFDRELLYQKTEEYNFFIDQLQIKAGQEQSFDELKIKDPLAF